MLIGDVVTSGEVKNNSQHLGVVPVKRFIESRSKGPSLTTIKKNPLYGTKKNHALTFSEMSAVQILDMPFTFSFLALMS